MALTKKQKLHRFMATSHKWIGLIVGIQVLFWTLGGVVMSWIPIEEVRGEHKVTHQAPVEISSNQSLLSFSEFAALSQKPIVRLTYDTLLGNPIAKLWHADKSFEIRSAVSGELLTPIGDALARQIAEADYAPDFPVANVVEMRENNIDYRGALPVWRVNFADDEATAIYVSPTQARVVGRRSSTWRFYDFFWMLHIMDYDERHDFNNPLLITFSFSALLFAISGIFLLFFRFYRRDFNFLLGKKVREVSTR